MTYNIFMKVLVFAAAFGAVQGGMVLLSILLRFRHRKNLPLALLLLVFSVRLATIPTWKEEILLAYPWIYPVTAPLPFLFGLFLWWYIREMTSEKPAMPEKLFLHFIPYLLETSAVLFTVISMDRSEYILFLDNVFSGNPPIWLPARNALKVAVNIAYVLLSWRIVSGSGIRRLSVLKRAWLKMLVAFPSAVLSAFAYVAIFPHVTGNLSKGDAAPFFILSVTMSILIYGVSFMFIIAPDLPLAECVQGKCSPEHICSDIECRYIAEMVKSRLEGGAFRNPDLMLSDLASELDIHPNRLSYAVNHSFNASFRTVLNNFRLDYFCRKVSAGALEKQSILDLAFEAGFPSKTTFNRFFREKTGISPSDYAKKNNTA